MAGGYTSTGRRGRGGGGGARSDRPGSPVCARCGLDARGRVGSVCGGCGEVLDRGRWLVWPAAGSIDRRTLVLVLLAHVGMTLGAHAVLVVLGVVGTDWAELGRPEVVQQRRDVIVQLGALSLAGGAWLGVLLVLLIRRRRLIHGSRRLPLSLGVITLTTAGVEWGFVALIALLGPPGGGTS
ncbi:MAG: hypothetical protein AAGI17_00700 [Planctomycetota bacterium]